MNDIIKKPGNYVALPSGKDPFEALGEALDPERIVGDLLKFVKGEWVAGQNEDEAPIGTKLIANMAEVKIGWLKWKDKKVVDTIMGRYVDGYVPPIRDSLGESDRSQWERDAQGEPLDPYAPTATLILQVPGEDRLFTWSVSSKGGRGALGKLCKSYGRQKGSHPNCFPIVSLELDSYRHPDFGKVHVPHLPIVAWTDQGTLGNEPQSENGAAAEPTATPSRQDLDDDIPF